jgi:4-amino-4-deoxy-L-arabinose transferase-like glycosyltransferase
MRRKPLGSRQTLVNVTPCVSPRILDANDIAKDLRPALLAPRHARDMSAAAQLQPLAVDGTRLRRTRWLVFAGALAIGVLTVLVIWRRQPMVAQANDIYAFADLGRNLASGNGLRFSNGPLTTRRAPGYPALIAILYLIFGSSPLVIQLAQCVLVAGTCLLVFEIGRLVFSFRTGVIAAVIVALHPMVLRYVPDIQVETLLTFLYTLTVYRTVRLVQEGSLANGLWAGVAAAAAAMVKGVALPYAALFIVSYLVWCRVARKVPAGGILPGWKPVAAMLVGMGIMILPWTVRNYEVTKKFVLISGNASGEFLRGYVFAQPRYYLLRDPPYTVGEQEANEMQRDLFRRRGLVWERDEAETETVQNLAAKAKLREEPGAFVKKFVIGSFMFWYVVTSRLNSLVVGAFAVVAWVLAFLGWRSRRDEGHAFWLLVVPIVSLNLIYAAVLALGRYSAPCVPTLAVLAAFGVESLLRRRALQASDPPRDEEMATAPSAGTAT